MTAHLTTDVPTCGVCGWPLPSGARYCPNGHPNGRQAGEPGSWLYRQDPSTATERHTEAFLRTAKYSVLRPKRGFLGLNQMMVDAWDKGYVDGWTAAAVRYRDRPGLAAAEVTAMQAGQDVPVEALSDIPLDPRRYRLGKKGDLWLRASGLYGQGFATGYHIRRLEVWADEAED